MKKIQKKRGFTIVELVIVIAVIAVLAAVLIPTFSSVIKKANLSADKQAVREMNMALAADEELHGKADTLEKAMKVLANAGYNSENWVCLTNGYTVYWWSKENRLVLYNATTAEVEYPDDFNIKKLVSADNGGEFYVYDNNTQKAIATDISLGSSSGGSSLANLSSSSAAATTTAQSSLAAVNNVLSSSSGTGLKEALGLSSAQYAYGTKEVASTIFGSGDSTAQATMQILSVGDTETPTADMLKSSGDVKENLFYISVNNSNASATDLASAQKAAGDMVYTIFTQVNSGQLDENVAIVLAPGTEIDVSGKEWSAIKEFEGYFGTADAANPIVINGAELTSATGYSQTVSFTGSQSKYFVTGFFGTIYGNTTIENVVFKNLKLDQPANDFEITKYSINGKKIDSRNSIGIIGGITDAAGQKTANVVLRNIVVDSTCEIICGADGGGLVGYIGSAESSGSLAGTVVIENCTVSAKVSNNYAYVSSGYGPVGGIVGFVCRVNADTFSLTIKDCTFDGSVDGTTMIGAAIGDLTNKCKVTFSGTNDFSNAKLNKQGKALKVGSVIGTIAKAYVKNNALIANTLTLGGTIKTADGVPAAFYADGAAYNVNGTKQ